LAPSQEERYLKWRTTALVIWASIGVLALAAAAFWGLSRLSAALTPFVMGFLIVFLLNAPVRALEKRGVRRSFAALICLLAAVAVIGAVLTVLGPALWHQLASFMHAGRSYLNRAQAAESAFESKVSALVLPPWLSNAIKQASAQLGQFVVSLGNSTAGAVVGLTGKIAEALLDIFLSLVIAFWVLTDLPKLRVEIIALAGPSYEADIEHLLRTVTRVVGGYLRGQTINSLTTATISAIGLTLLHVPYSLVVGLIAFVFNYAPYVGPVTTGLIAGLLGMFAGPWTALGAVVVVVVAQNVTDFVVAPRVMSSQVDLHPTLVIFSLLVGGTLFGVPGLLFAIPVAAVAKGLFVYYYERRTERPLGSEDGALFRHRLQPVSPPSEAEETGDEPACSPADSAE
jgi:predicted PurR-regulated permease PerM